MIKTDYSKAQQNDNLKPEGEYECVIHKIEEKTTQNGKCKLSVWLEIRSDVEQSYKNGFIFHDIWAKKEPNMDDAAVKGYNYAQLMALASATKLPQDKEYPDLDTLLADLTGKPVRVTLYHDHYNGKVYEKVRWVNTTNFPDLKHKPKTAKNTANPVTYAAPSSPQFAGTQTVSVTAEESDDDYPF